MFDENEETWVCKQELDGSWERGRVGSNILAEDDFINNMIVGKKQDNKKAQRGHFSCNSKRAVASAINFICVCQGLGGNEKIKLFV